MARWGVAVATMLGVSCSSGGGDGGRDAARSDALGRDVGGDVRGADATSRDGASIDATAPAGPLSMEVRFLGVGGFSFRVGDDAFVTAPMYSNPDLIRVVGGEIAADPERVGRLMQRDAVAPARAILVGHAHYDHLLDVPLVREATSGALVIANLSARNLLAGVLPPEAMLAVDDPGRPLVDRRMCAEPAPCTGAPAGAEGEWIPVPGAKIRVRALCSSHPPQILGGGHFGEGCVDAPLPAPPVNAAEWLEGATVGYLVDFLDDDGRPTFRVFYQDAPTDGPTGHVHPSLLAERRIDLAVLNVGSWDKVGDHPGEAIRAHSPRYVLAGHWENFFRPQDQPIQPIPVMASADEFDQRARDALAGDEAVPPVEVDGVAIPGRYWRPLPGARFVFPAASLR